MSLQTMKSGLKAGWGSVVLAVSLVVALTAAVAVCLGNWLVARRYASAPQVASLVVSPKYAAMDGVNQYESSMSGRIAVRTFAETGIANFIAQ